MTVDKEGKASEADPTAHVVPSSPSPKPSSPGMESKDVDDAKLLLQGVDTRDLEIDLTDKAKERRLLRRIDLLLIPIMFCCYGLQYYDKALLGSASQAGLLTDLQLSVTDPPPPGSPPGTPGRPSLQRFSWATSLFYFGALTGILPAAFLCQRLPIAKFLAVMVAIWSSIVLLTPACTTFRGLFANRFFLGLVESVSSPAFLLITGMWYKKDEAIVRIGIWYSATGVCACFASLLNYAIGHIKGALSPWKYMYLVAGSVTMLWALLIWLFLPDSPTRASRWLSVDERRHAVLRIRGNLTGVENRHFKPSQVLCGLLDVQLWLYFFLVLCIYVTNGGVTSFGSIIIHGFGYSPLQSILLFAPSGPCTVLSIAIVSLLAYYFPNIRTLLLPLACLPVIAGAIMIWKGDWENRAVPLAGIYMVSSFGGPMVLTLSLASANVAGHTKKALSAGMTFAAYNVGNIIAPYTVIASEQDIHFRTTWIAIIICMSASCVLSLTLRLVLQRRNALRSAESARLVDKEIDGQAGGPTELASKENDGTAKRASLTPSDPHSLDVRLREKALATALDDLTDRENPHFVCTL